MSASDPSIRLDLSARLWMFDFDNTLVALEETVDWASSRAELEPMLREAGCPAGLFEEFPRGNLGLYDAIMSRLRAGAFTPAMAPGELLQRASNIIEFHELAGADRAQALPGAAELLAELAKRQTGVVIVTSNSSRTVYRWLARARLVYTVRTVVGRDGGLALKPAPDVVRHALARCNVDPNAALFVGDSDADQLAAQAAGVRFVAIAQTAQRRARMSDGGADAIFSSPAELLHALREA
jgi:HAD superfamily hydrolase (TIGR01509 family)